MKRLLTILIAFIAAAQIFAIDREDLKMLSRRVDFTVDGINYQMLYRRIDDNNKRLTDTLIVVSGSDIPSSGRLVIPRNVDFGGSTYTVGIIGSGAFEDRKDLREIVLPESITDIRGTAFAGCTDLRSVNIPDGVTELGTWCFRDCRKLADVKILSPISRLRGVFDDAGVKKLTLSGISLFNGYAAFTGSMNLDELTLDSSEVTLKDVRSKLVRGNGGKVFVDTNGLPESWKVGNRIA
ncbi:MAG: leucine-rich repeat domain-containing protein, partial [Duncaniella sp.]|nr:leucine-rich repeat domain-containing protein [Duncaniella sp.]